MEHRGRFAQALGAGLLLFGATGLNLSYAQTAASNRSVLIAKKNQVESAGAAPATVWKMADVGLQLAIHDRLRTGDLSQASVRLTNLSVLQIDELTTIEILPPKGPTRDKPSLDVKAGQIYFFSRDKPR